MKLYYHNSYDTFNNQGHNEEDIGEYYHLVIYKSSGFRVYYI